MSAEDNGENGNNGNNGGNGNGQNPAELLETNARRMVDQHGNAVENAEEFREYVEDQGAEAAADLVEGYLEQIDEGYEAIAAVLGEGADGYELLARTLEEAQQQTNGGYDRLQALLEGHQAVDSDLLNDYAGIMGRRNDRFRGE